MSCDAKSQGDANVIDILLAPGIHGEVMSRFMKAHLFFRHCVTQDFKDAFQKHCDHALANDCTVNNVQFCAHPVAADAATAAGGASTPAKGWLQVANAPPRNAQTFPVLPPHDDPVLTETCTATVNDFKSDTTPTSSVYNPGANSTALKRFMCLQRGKTQSLVNDPTIGRNLDTRERLSRSKSFNNILDGVAAASTVATTSAKLLAPAAGMALAASVAPVAVFGAPALVAWSAAGHQAAKKAVSAPTVAEAAVKTKETLEMHQKQRDKSESMLSNTDQAIWKCLTHQCHAKNIVLPRVDVGFIAPSSGGKIGHRVESFFCSYQNHTPSCRAYQVVGSGTEFWKQYKAIGQSHQTSLGNDVSAIVQPACGTGLEGSDFDKPQDSSVNAQNNAQHLLASALNLSPGAYSRMFGTWANKNPTQTHLSLRLPEDPAWRSFVLVMTNVGDMSDSDRVAICAQPMYVKLGRLHRIEQVLINQQRQLGRMPPDVPICPAALLLFRTSTYRTPKFSTDILTHVPPLLYVWYMLSGAAGTDPMYAYWHLDYVLAIAQFYLSSPQKPFPEDRSPQNEPLFQAARKGLEEAQARHARCVGLLTVL